MSKKTEERVVSLEELVARAEELKEYAGAIQSALNTYLTQYTELQLVIETLKSLPQGSPQIYVLLNRLGSAMIPAQVSEGWETNIIVNLGLNYYARATREQGVSILEKRLQAVKKIIDRLQRDYKSVVEEYSYIQQILAQVYAQLQSRQAGASGRAE
ncbi:MAG: ATP-binding protein [Thermogladius sp.]|jgi:prefoldin alpha subunit|uniref:Prefoldin subunit alpha n=1 Tax=Thermogladius calderae TaxID=1200300 RepID=A0A7J3XWZ9_9CREN|nr:ATP-binding protein [Thermogladius sp.]